MSLTIHRRAFLGLAASTALLVACEQAQAAEQFDAPPPGFTSAKVSVNGTSLHYVRGGQGPAVILIHGMPEDWTEYKAIMPRLAQRFTVVAVDLPGIGQSAPAAGGYEAASLAADIHAMAQSLEPGSALCRGPRPRRYRDLRLCPPLPRVPARRDDPRCARTRRCRLGRGGRGPLAHWLHSGSGTTGREADHRPAGDLFRARLRQRQVYAGPARPLHPHL